MAVSSRRALIDKHAEFLADALGKELGVDTGTCPAFRFTNAVAAARAFLLATELTPFSLRILSRAEHGGSVHGHEVNAARGLQDLGLLSLEDSGPKVGVVSSSADLVRSMSARDHLRWRVSATPVGKHVLKLSREM